MISVKRYAIFKALLTEPNPTAIRCSSTTSTARILISTIVSSAMGATSTFTAGTLRTSSSISRQIPWSGGTRLRPRRETRGRPATGFRRYAMESIDFEEVDEQFRRDTLDRADRKLTIPRGNGNTYPLPDESVIDADAFLYDPHVFTERPEAVVSDFLGDRQRDE